MEAQRAKIKKSVEWNIVSVICYDFGGGGMGRARENARTTSRQAGIESNSFNNAIIIIIIASTEIVTTVIVIISHIERLYHYEQHMICTQ